MATFAGWEGRLAPALNLLFLTVLFHSHAVAQLRPADLIVINANIRTITSRDARADALAVRGNRFIAVGKNSQIKTLVGPETRVIDAGGRLVLPGFNDSHVHFMGIGNTFSSMDLREVKSGTEILQRVGQYIRFLPSGRWILGGGLPIVLSDRPTRKALDASSPANPIFVYSADAASAFANSLAFARAGLKDDSPGVERDALGAPTGIVRDAALQRIRRAVPPDHTQQWPAIGETATNYAASLGVTSVQDMHSDDNRTLYLELQQKRKLKTRVYDCVPLPDWKKLADSRLTQTSGAMIRDGCLKTFSDGDASDAANLRRDIAAADKAGLQVMVHAIGQSANNIVLGVFEDVAKLNGARDRRLRVEHAHNPAAADVARFARGKFVASMQPHLFEFGNGEFYATLLRQNAPLAFGSDAAMIDLNPLLGIHAAVNAEAEAISVYDAVRAYTVGSAFAEFQEKEKGTIEPGQLADFVILSDDIFTVEPTGIRYVTIVKTIVDGRVVFESE